MKKTILLIIISFFLFGCKVKRTVKNQSKEIEKIEVISKTETTQKDTEKTSTVGEIRTVQNQTKTEDKKDLEIKAKVDDKNPLSVYNVINGDTIDIFKVTGNAEVIFKSSNNSRNSSLNNNLISNTTNTKESEKSLSNAVENVKTAIKEVQTKSVEVVKKDFQFGTYLVFFIWGIAIIVILGLIYYFRKTNLFSNIWNKFKK